MKGTEKPKPKDAITNLLEALKIITDADNEGYVRHNPRGSVSLMLSAAQWVTIKQAVRTKGKG